MRSCAASGLLPQGRQLAECIRVHATVNTITPEVNVYSTSHTLKLLKEYSKLGTCCAVMLPASFSSECCCLPPQFSHCNLLACSQT